MTNELRGFSMPFRIDSTTGGVVQTVGAEKLKENVIQILLTDIGERVMRRDYGGGLRQLLHDPGNDALRAILQHQIGKAIAEHEPHVLVQGVTVALQEGTLFLHVDYTIRRTQSNQSVSVPIGLGGI